jgi:protein gp37
MGKSTEISWCDHTFNPAWGCQEVSPGCQHCYARTLAQRWGHHVWGKDAPRRLFGSKHWAEPYLWDAQAVRDGRQHRVFCASMADVFEAHPTLDEVRPRLWAMIERTPHLTWQLLTKRPENVRAMVPPAWFPYWPENVWLMISAENHEQASLRVPWLIEIVETACGTPTTGISAEPLLGAIDFNRLDWLPRTEVARLLRGTHDRAEADALALHWQALWDSQYARYCGRDFVLSPLENRLIDWVIVGGESGPRHRPMHLDWARQIRDDCRCWGVAFFLKQIGGQTPKANGKALDGEEWCAFPESA